MSLDKITIPLLKGLFNHVCTKANIVAWIRDKTYKRQLYLDPRFEVIWKADINQIYRSPEHWNDYLHPDDAKTIIQHLEHRAYQPDKIKDNSMLFRIFDAGGSLHFIKDTSFMLIDEQGQLVGHAGIGEEISEQEFEIGLQCKQLPIHLDPQRLIRQQIMNALQEELKLKATPNNYNHSINESNPFLVTSRQQPNLTPQEKVCLKYLLQGYSAKQTARHTQTSPRTVEFHLNNIRQKLGCRNKLELISRFSQQLDFESS